MLKIHIITYLPVARSCFQSDDMAKSARASGIKKNKRALKKRVFGPVETARNERLSAKLLELAQQPKPALNQSEIDLESQGMRSPAAISC